MKNILIVLSVPFFITIFNLKYYNNPNTAEVVINVNNLNSSNIISSLEKDFNNYKGIKFIEGSLMSNTIILEVEKNDIQISTLNQLLENWGCSIKSISYRILSNIQ